MIAPEQDPLPRVTFAIFAYNQQDFIDRSIEAAFNQDYGNLEIILSDDRSSDRTFEIIEDSASRYRGPHTVRTSRTAANRGIVAHLYDVARKSEGELLVAAAADDLSHPGRASRLASEWSKTRSSAIFSDYDMIDDLDEILSRGAPLSRIVNNVDRYFSDVSYIPYYLGATAAYSRDIFELIEEPESPIMMEDHFLAFMLRLRRRKIAFVEEALISYRQHSQSISSFSKDGTLASERTFERFSMLILPVLELVERAVDGAASPSPDVAVSGIDIGMLRDDIRFYRFQARWLSSSFFSRLTALVHARSYAHIRWLMPRLLGSGALIRLKQARDRFSRWRAV